MTDRVCWSGERAKVASICEVAFPLTPQCASNIAAKRAVQGLDVQRLVVQVTL